MFVHPKTGAHGSDNITDESKAYLYKKVLECIQSKDLMNGLWMIHKKEYNLIN